jgi:hypothetical protein
MTDKNFSGMVVGGPWDGRLLAYPTRSLLAQPRDVPPRPSWDPFTTEEVPEMDKDVPLVFPYKHVEVDYDGGCLGLWIPEDRNTAWAISHVVRAYAPTEPRTELVEILELFYMSRGWIMQDHPEITRRWLDVSRKIKDWIKDD